MGDNWPILALAPCSGRRGIRVSGRCTLTDSSVRLRHFLYLFWAGMDAFYICLYCLRSAARGDVPFWSDFQSGLEVIRSWGGPEVLIWAGLVLQGSVVVSCIGLYAGKNWAVYLAMLQIPFRYFFIVPSVSIVLVLPMIIAEINNWIWGAGLLSSELVKGLSLWWLRRQVKPLRC